MTTLIKGLYLTGLFLLPYLSIEVKGQDETIIRKIRQQYSLIINKEIKGIKVDTLDLSQPVTANDIEGTRRSVSKYILYHTTADTFLIKHISIYDEGGPYRIITKEISYWDAKPFFYYEVHENFFIEGTREEKRLYIAKGKVIKKLIKEFTYYKPFTGYIHASMDTIPNKNGIVKADDILIVTEFENSCKSDLKLIGRRTSSITR